MNDLAVIVPVLARPQRAQPLVDSLAAAATLDCRLVFVCSPGDDAEIAACRKTGADVLVAGWEAGPGDWARKINHAYRVTSEPLLLFGADDIDFHPGFDTAMAAQADQGFGVIGCRDLGNSTVDAGHHCCHPLVSRAYIDACGTVDECGIAVHEGYAHNWVDVELVDTAKARGAWSFTWDAVIEHFHPFWRKAADDPTYARGRAGYQDDARLFQTRQRLWEQVAA